MTVIAPFAGNSAANSETKDIFSSEENILRALSFVRHSPIAVKEKDSLRDLFLSYTGTYDEKNRDKVKTKIIELLRSRAELSSLLPSEKAVGQQSKSSDGIGSTRPIPSFASIVTNTPISESAKPQPTVETLKANPTPIAPISKPAEPAVEDIKPQAAIAEPVPAPSPVPEPPQIVTPIRSGSDTKTRIDAIKRDINSKFGNPVNLIDKNEQVGREYMTALLDAMKRSSRGDGDLSRLEAAYQAALTVMPGITTPQPMPAAAPKPPPAVTPPPEIIEPVTPPKPIAPTPTAAAAIAVPAPVAEPIKPPMTPTTDSVKSSITRTSSGLYHRPEDEMDEIQASTDTLPTKKSRFSLSTKLIRPEAVDALKESRPVSERPVPVSAPVPALKSVPKIEKPVARELPVEKPLSVKETDTTLPEQISKLKEAASAREEAAKKPIVDLNAPEIDQGLKQLLSEWSLFKGGGLFRSKPSGLDNALYKQLSKLPMASVVAGRFEGVTPEIKHELADYMTGWRYERGVVHEMGETFEHYLRRVVKEILERQRQATKASDKK